MWLFRLYGYGLLVGMALLVALGAQKDSSPPQTIEFVLRNLPGTACEVKLVPGEKFECRGHTSKEFVCVGIKVLYKQDCLTLEASREEAK